MYDYKPEIERAINCIKILPVITWSEIQRIAYVYNLNVEVFMESLKGVIVVDGQDCSEDFTSLANDFESSDGQVRYVYKAKSRKS